MLTLFNSCLCKKNFLIKYRFQIKSQSRQTQECQVNEVSLYRLGLDMNKQKRSLQGLGIFKKILDGLKYIRLGELSTQTLVHSEVWDL